MHERTRELSTLLDVSATVASTLDLNALLGLVLDQLKGVADYTGASILMVDGAQLVLVEMRGASAQDGSIKGASFNMEPGNPLSEALLHQEAVIVGDVLDDSPLANAYRSAVGYRIDNPSFSYARSWMAAPMVLNNRAIGVISLSHREPNFYTREHGRLASAIATHAAIAIENAKMYGQAQELAAMEERQRLARELHDSVTQSLFSINLLSSAIPKLLDRDLAAARERLDRLHQLAAGALAEMRGLIVALRPEALERDGLIGALRKQVEALEAQHHLSVDQNLGAEPDAPVEVKEALYRIAQEALRNTVKHARARNVELRLDCDALRIALLVSDDGVGFDPAFSAAGHLGQQSMRERAAQLGGTVVVESARGQGTRVRAVVPLRPVLGS